MMDNLRAMCDDYLKLYRDGDRDMAFFGLVEAPNAIIPHLISTFRCEKDADVRAFLVEVIWQHRDPETIPFLSEAMWDSSQSVWKEALDGLVTLGTVDSIDALRHARTRTFSSAPSQTEFQAWVDEALAQVTKN